jgi:hypothetical protein
LSGSNPPARGRAEPAAPILHRARRPASPRGASAQKRSHFHDLLIQLLFSQLESCESRFQQFIALKTFLGTGHLVSSYFNHN